MAGVPDGCPGRGGSTGASGRHQVVHTPVAPLVVHEGRVPHVLARPAHLRAPVDPSLPPRTSVPDLGDRAPEKVDVKGAGVRGQGGGVGDDLLLTVELGEIFSTPLVLKPVNVTKFAHFGPEYGRTRERHSPRQLSVVGTQKGYVHLVPDSEVTEVGLSPPRYCIWREQGGDPHLGSALGWVSPPRPSVSKPGRGSPPRSEVQTETGTQSPRDPHTQRSKNAGNNRLRDTRIQGPISPGTQESRDSGTQGPRDPGT